MSKRLGRKVHSEQPIRKAALITVIGLGSLIGVTASATGYYNFGMNWKGGLNAYHLQAIPTFQTGFTAGLTSPTMGMGDGSIGSSSWVAVGSSGNIYVADTDNSRISKYDSTGAFQGWIGKIGASPTGGAAGCTGASAGTFTPGWCKGGWATIGSGDGMLTHPIAIAVDASENIYVVDNGNYRIVKYNSSGVFQGWIGKVGATPTGGAAGCSSAAIGSNTPGWCKGGAGAQGSGDGMFNEPSGVAVDSTGNVYVTDATDSRVSKFDSAGAFQGWIGNINTSPTGGAAGCSSASSGTFTPGWCTGGTAQSGADDGMMDDAEGILTDPAGNLYVVDLANGRVNKYSSAGAFLGWTGTVDGVPSGGAPGCDTANVGDLTPGWCIGGRSIMSHGDGSLSEPDSIAIDSSGNLYVSSANSNRINKYNSSGVYQGWIGGIDTSPTGGASGCNGASPGTVTPGWCIGGSDLADIGDGMMNYPLGVAVNPSTGELYVSDSNNYRINRYTSAGAFSGALQSVLIAYPWSRSDSRASGGSTDGALYYPSAVASDDFGNLYVTNGSQINKYDSSGVFQGWIGKIGVSPTGGAAGCSIAPVGSFTPGWCKGGASTDGNGDGMLNYPSGIAIDSSGNLYVADTDNHRINKYSSSGAFLGWIGKVGTTPTGGAAGCSTAPADSITPGWCTGGTPSTSWDNSANGAMVYPSGLALDSAGNIYVANTTVAQITKYNSSGAFQGWIGKVSTTPTGGASGCSTAASGTVTPGWCIGGSSASGNLDGNLDNPVSLAIDSNGNLYIADSYNERVVKYDSTGVFQGWIGKILTTPTGGAAGCTSAAPGTATPGWCTGGTSDSGGGDGEFDFPNGITLDSHGNLYVTETNNERVSKFNSAGVFQGWIGNISSSPTGGATGCNGAAVYTITPGWCKGGSSAGGDRDGAMDAPYGLTIDSSGNIYVADLNNNRVVRYSTQGR